MTRITVPACAKINLWLEVKGRRDDGFHDIETVMHEIELHDLVHVTATAATTDLTIDDPTIPNDESNLALRALRVFERHVGAPFPCRIEIEKRIPAGGGLAGGSSDGVAVLRAVNELSGAALDVCELQHLAAEFGSDTAFFVLGGTAVCRGRGELVEPIKEFDRTLHVVLVLPGFSVSTPEVFRALRLTGIPHDGYAWRRLLATPDAPTMRGEVFNRLEEPARRLHPRLDELLDEFAAEGVRLSGSGSTLFALADSREEAEVTAAALSRRTGVRTLVTTSARRPGRGGSVGCRSPMSR